MQEYVYMSMIKMEMNKIRAGKYWSCVYGPYGNLWKTNSGWLDTKSSFICLKCL